MGFYKVDYEILDFLKSNGMEGGSVLEFGAQDLREDRMGNAVAKRISTDSVYYDYGFSHYQCIDMEGEHNALVFDLGQNLREVYDFKETFNLVTVKEIGHWIFDQKTLFDNIHNAVKDGGYIIWRSPIVGGYGAGCFAYMPNKILQLIFCNSYRYMGAWVYQQLFGLDDKKESIFNIYTFEPYKAYNFLEDLKNYVASSKCLKNDMLFRLTMVFKKCSGGGGGGDLSFPSSLIVQQERLLLEMLVQFWRIVCLMLLLEKLRFLEWERLQGWHIFLRWKRGFMWNVL